MKLSPFEFPAQKLLTYRSFIKLFFDCVYVFFCSLVRIVL